jgi:ABC-2 type transport system permease protein
MSVVGRATWLVAKRELTEGFRTKSFRIVLAISAIAAAGLVAIFGLTSDSGGSVTDVVVVGSPASVDPTRIAAVGDAIGTEVRVRRVSNDDEARRAVASGTAELGVLADGRELLTDEHLDLDGDSKLAVVVNVLRSELALTEGLLDAGLTPDQAAQVRATELPAVTSVQPVASDADPGRTSTTIVMNILLFLMLQTYGGWVVSGVTREKASRVVEVLLSTLSSRQLMFGKILGIGLLALIHAGVMVITAVVTARIVGLGVLDGFRVGDLAVGLVWFLLGYVLYCCAFAAGGSLISRPEEAQGVALPIMLPLILGYIVGFSASEGPNTLLWVLSFVPPTAVLCMPVLSATGAVPVWAVLVSIAITAAFAYVVAMGAARIYERSILKTGKRVRWRDAFSRRADAAA